MFHQHYLFFIVWYFNDKSIHRINFNEVYTVYLDDDKCPQRKEDLRFNLDSPENKPAIAFISRFDVESVEIVDLEKLRQQKVILKLSDL